MTHTIFADSVNTPDSLLLEGDFTSETAIEFNYAAQVTPWLLVQPTFQYYFNTGGSGRREDAGASGRTHEGGVLTARRIQPILSSSP